MITSKERQEVAEQLRENALRWRKVIKENAGITGEIDLGEVCSVMQDVMHFCGIDGKTDAPTILNRLADLIDPTCRMTDSEWDNGERTWGCICSACDAHIEHTYSFSLDYCPHCGARVTERAMDLRRKTKL